MGAGGLFIGIGWSIVQKVGGTGVTLTAYSIEHVWTAIDFVLFGIAGVCIVLVLAARVHELWTMGSAPLKLLKTDVSVQLTLIVVLILLVMGVVTKVHMHHYFIGSVLTLSMARTKRTLCIIPSCFGFGLFLHGAAVWGVSPV